jgi:hypothetical protein
MTTRRTLVRLGLGLSLLLASSCESASPLEEQGAAAPTAATDAEDAAQAGAGGEAQLSNEELERLLEALENELAAQSANGQ